NWRTSLPRPAPSARRMAICFVRLAPRAKRDRPPPSIRQRMLGTKARLLRQSTSPYAASARWFGPSLRGPAQTAESELPFPLALDRCSSPEPACQRFAAADSMVRAASHFAALIAFAFPAAPRSQALLADYPSR